MAGSRLSDVTNAAVDALVADSALATLLGGSAKVFTHIPEDTPVPYVLVLGGQEIPWVESFEPGDDAREVEVDMLVVSAYRGTKEIDAITNRGLEVLTTHASWNEGSAAVVGYAGCGFRRCERPAMSELTGRIYFERLSTVVVWVN
jgi:hypothetical protein